MVSIPDWTKFQRLHDTPKEVSSLSSLDKYYKQREEETIRQAENQGLLKTPSQAFLVNKCGPINGKNVKDVLQLRLVKLCGVHLRKVGDLSYCMNLRICLLSDNFLTKIDGLQQCRSLVKLDLHGNQLSVLPGLTFWSGLRHLRVLHLHDNPLGKYENLQNLATCPSLVALTLYDTPLSLKRNYRHHVVNSIWTLKALDNYVISDEEIIEDAVFGGIYATKQPAFRINLFYSTSESHTFAEELQIVRSIECRINKILAHHSPVLIVQRYTRGYLTRKKLGRDRMSKVKSAGGTTPAMVPSDVVPPPPSSSPVPEPAIQEMAGPPSEASNEFDSYAKSHRGNSAAPSDISRYQQREQAEGYQEPYPTPMDMAFQPGTPSEVRDGGDGSPRKRKNLCINLAKLQSGPFSSLYDDQIAVETVLPRQLSEITDPGKKKVKKKKEKSTSSSSSQKRVVKSVKQFFGPVVESTPTPDMDEKTQEEDEDIPVTEYRLRGQRPNIMLIDPTTEMLLSKQEAGRVVRDAEVEHHRKQQDLPTPRTKATKKTMNNDQRIFARVHGTMGMSCLFAVHQAYKDREKAEKTASKMENIMSMRDERERAKERIKLYHEEKRTSALKQRDLEREKTLQQLEKREMMRINYLDRRHEHKDKANDLTKSYKQDFTFITEFSNQHTSVSNALMRHDRQAKYEDTLQSRLDQIQGLSAAEKEQKDVVKKYLEHRQLMRQTESAMARATLDTRMLQEANERMLEAKTRVAQQKARQETVQSFFPLPVMTPVPTASSAPPMIAHGLTRWETQTLITHGRIGKHPTMVL